MKRAVVSGGFDDLRSGHIRFLQEAARLGELQVLLWSDALFRFLEGKPPKFAELERRYLLEAIRYVNQVRVILKSEVRSPKSEAQVAFLTPVLKEARLKPDIRVVNEAQDGAAAKACCQTLGIDYHVVRNEDLRGFPELGPVEPAASSSRKKVLVTGCYDWFHSGHVRFFEEVAELGDLYVVVGHDANIRALKGRGHPLFPETERRYMVEAVRYVKQALISTGQGWLDAEPEIQRIKPDIYAVNEDGDRPEKRACCEQHHIQYHVLKRTPKAGLPQRRSTALRGF